MRTLPIIALFSLLFCFSISTTVYSNHSLLDALAILTNERGISSQNILNTISDSTTSQPTLQPDNSSLVTYRDPENDFTIEYDPNTWFAVPDSNRFDEFEVDFIDRATNGKQASLSIGFIEDPTPSLGLAVQMSNTRDELEDITDGFRLEEEMECEKMSIMRHLSCSYIFSTPSSDSDSYSRDYAMMVNAKLEGKIWMMAFSAPGDQFEKFEQMVIQMANSMKAPESNSWVQIPLPP